MDKTMIKEELPQNIKDIIMVGEFMEIKNLFSYKFDKMQDWCKVYIAEDEYGDIDYVDVGINWYEPDCDWNQLMVIINKIENLGYNIKINSTNDNGLYNDCIITNEDDCFYRYFERCGKMEAVYNCVIEFIKWYNGK